MNLIYIVICILLQFLVEVNSQKTILNPDLRSAHTATLINDKLYILGGGLPFGAMKSPKETFIYLDVSAPFNTNQLKWIDLSNNNIVPSHRFATAFKGGASNDTLFLYGGESLNGEGMDLVYTFDTKSNVWSIPKTTGILPSRRHGMNPIVSDNGLIYLYGGVTKSAYTNEMYILDTINLSWKQASSIGAPSPRVQYGAVLLPNKNIIYMGGINVDTIGVSPMDPVYLYDTINDNWMIKLTDGLIPTPRYSFSSILGLDGQSVIIFGGYEDGIKILVNPLYVLGINDFKWYIPKVSGTIPPSRAFHKTVLIGKYMVVTFGDYTQAANNVLLLDISNNDEYIWTTSFVPPPPPPPPPLPPSSSSSSVPSSSVSSSPSLPISSSTTTIQSNTQSSNPGIIVGAVIGSLVGGILLSIGGSFFYKRYKNNKKQNQAIPTPGNSYFQGVSQIPEEGTTYYQDVSQIPRERTTYYQGQQAIPPYQIQPIYNHGQEAAPNIQEPIYNHGQEAAPNIQESIYNHGQEAALQDTRLSVLSNDQNSLQNFKNEILQAVREEVRMARNS